MSRGRVLHDFLKNSLSFVHAKRLNAFTEVITAVTDGAGLTISQIGRSIRNSAKIKHNIKKVDRLCGNNKLQSEVPEFYSSMAAVMLKKLPKSLPIIIDVCYLKDHHELQTIRASFVINKRSLTLYELSYPGSEMKKSHEQFLQQLRKIIPENQSIIFLLDAGFKANWCNNIAAYGWDWIARIRNKGGHCYLNNGSNWLSPSSLFLKVKQSSHEFGNILWSKKNKLSCRLVGFTKKIKGIIKKTYSGKRSKQKDSKSYSRNHREPWLLATSLNSTTHSPKDIARIYEKRMSIEEGFRDLKRHRFGLQARYSGTKSSCRWNILLLIANFALFIIWMVGWHVRKLDLASGYQSNTRKNRKEFSDIFLGKIYLQKLSFQERERCIANAWSLLKNEVMI